MPLPPFSQHSPHCGICPPHAVSNNSHLECCTRYRQQLPSAVGPSIVLAVIAISTKVHKRQCYTQAASYVTVALPTRGPLGFANFPPCHLLLVLLLLTAVGTQREAAAAVAAALPAGEAEGRAALLRRQAERRLRWRSKGGLAARAGLLLLLLRLLLTKQGAARHGPPRR